MNSVNDMLIFMLALALSVFVKTNLKLHELREHEYHHILPYITFVFLITATTTDVPESI